MFTSSLEGGQNSVYLQVESTQAGLQGHTETMTPFLTEPRTTGKLVHSQARPEKQIILLMAQSYLSAS